MIIVSSQQQDQLLKTASATPSVKNVFTNVAPNLRNLLKTQSISSIAVTNLVPKPIVDNSVKSVTVISPVTADLQTVCFAETKLITTPTKAISSIPIPISNVTVIPLQRNQQTVVSAQIPNPVQQTILNNSPTIIPVPSTTRNLFTTNSNHPVQVQLVNKPIPISTINVTSPTVQNNIQNNTPVKQEQVFLNYSQNCQAVPVQQTNVVPIISNQIPVTPILPLSQSLESSASSSIQVSTLNTPINTLVINQQQHQQLQQQQQQQQQQPQQQQHQITPSNSLPQSPEMSRSGSQTMSTTPLPPGSPEQTKGNATLSKVKLQDQFNTIETLMQSLQSLKEQITNNNITQSTQNQIQNLNDIKPTIYPEQSQPQPTVQMQTQSIPMSIPMQVVPATSTNVNMNNQQNFFPNQHNILPIVLSTSATPVSMVDQLVSQSPQILNFPPQVQEPTAARPIANTGFKDISNTFGTSIATCEVPSLSLYQHPVSISNFPQQQQQQGPQLLSPSYDQITSTISSNQLQNNVDTFQNTSVPSLSNSWNPPSINDAIATNKIGFKDTNMTDPTSNNFITNFQSMQNQAEATGMQISNNNVMFSEPNVQQNITVMEINPPT